nr:DUF418 domain-containing protein [Staphylococcus xylosus]
MLWLKYFKLGPLEYIWKLATYMKWINMKKIKLIIKSPRQLFRSRTFYD